MIDLVGNLPNTWKWCPLKHATVVLRRGSTPEYTDDGPIHVVNQAVNQGHRLEWSKGKFHAFFGDPCKLKGHLKESDLLINSTGTGTLGRVGFFSNPPDERPAIADSHITIARMKNDLVHPRYAYYWLSSRKFHELIYSTMAMGSTNQIELNREHLSQAPIPLPPLDEQRRIVDFLDAETARIDRLSTLRQKWTETLRERWAIEVEEYIQRSRPGRVELRRALAGPPQYGAQVSGELGTEEWPRYIRITDIDEDGGLRDTDVRRISPEYARPFILRDNDILLARSGATVGKIFRFRSHFGPAAFAGYLIRLTLNQEKISPEFLETWMKTSEYWSQIGESEIRATIQNVSAERYKSLKIPLPNLETQRRITEAALTSLRTVRDLQGKVKRQLALLTERRQALITTAVTGQIDVTTARGADVS